MRDALPDIKGDGREVRGQVSASGGIVSGSGFAVSKTGTGAYLITFLPPFKAPPLWYPVAAAATNSFFPINSITQYAVAMQTNNPALSPADTAFSFIAKEASPA